MPISKNTAKRKPSKARARASNSYQREHYVSSGNVFTDMGKSEEEANNLFMRSTLMIAIEEIIAERGWTQAEAATVIGVARPRIAELCGSRIDLFTLDTLIKYLNKLGKQVTLIIKDSEVA
ncbi:MAG: XRE family transcriptional regulator [Candidatus Melainabacteria bacterium]|nr:XRE family transcriptional regulator [Candidatus Melainabacteria bacterium]